jgi:hypothetical protein
MIHNLVASSTAAVLLKLWCDLHQVCACGLRAGRCTAGRYIMQPGPLHFSAAWGSRQGRAEQGNRQAVLGTYLTSEVFWMQQCHSYSGVRCAHWCWEHSSCTGSCQQLAGTSALQCSLAIEQQAEQMECFDLNNCCTAKTNSQSCAAVCCSKERP